MKTILCYGDSNTWGNIAGSCNPELMLAPPPHVDIAEMLVYPTDQAAASYLYKQGQESKNLF